MSSSDGALADAIDALPQHPPMRLIDRAISIEAHRAVAQVHIGHDALFVTGPGPDGAGDAPGIPSWVALEYLGQTAALIGQANAAPHPDAGPLGSPQSNPQAGTHAGEELDGFLLGSRQLDLDPEPFRPGDILTVTCTARGEVGATLATFDGEVHDASGRLRASGTLSVVRMARGAP